MNTRKLPWIIFTAAAISLGGGSLCAAVPDFGDGSLKLWLEADSITGHTNGQAVSIWNDSSDNGNNAIAGAPSTTPIYDSTAMNGKPVVRFDGINDLLDAGNGFPITGTGLTIFTVLRFNSSDGSQGILGNRGGGAGYMLGEEGPPSFNDKFVFVGGTTQLTSAPGIPGSLVGKKLVLEALKDGGTLTMFTNAVQFATSGGDGNLTDLGGDVLIGANPQQSSFNGDLAEVLIYNRALNAGERATVTEYFFAKYSIPEPSSVALLGLGSMMVLWRRRS